MAKPDKKTDKTIYKGLTQLLVGLTMATSAAFAAPPALENTDQITEQEALSYKNAIYYNELDTISTLEQSFSLRNIKPDKLKNIRDQALIHTAETHPDRTSLELALKYGANINALNKEGKSVGELILDHGLQYFPLIIYLHEKYQYNVNFLHWNRDKLWSLFSKSEALPPHKNYDMFAHEALKFIKSIGFDILSIQDKGTDLTLEDVLRTKNATQSLQFLHNNKIHFKPRSKKLWAFSTYQSYFQNVNVPLVDIPYKSYKQNDFKSYQPITYDHNLIPDNHMTPSLFIAENATDGIIEHIKNAGRVAYGVRTRLQGKAPSMPDSILALEQNPVINSENDLTNILSYNTKNYLIVSNSVHDKTDHISKNKKTVYQTNFSFHGRPVFDKSDQRSFVLYDPAGNDEQDDCITIDKVSFCMQDTFLPSYHNKTVRTGAAYKKSNNTYTIPSYSENRPAFCSLIPNNNSIPYSGTSFSTPAAAAVEQSLADIFGRSADFPNGVVHEDILMALMLTAHTNGLIQEGARTIIPTFNTIAGIPMTDRCGVGIIQPQAAADLLTEMVTWTQNDEQIIPTEPETLRLDSSLNHYTQNNKGHYVYTMTFPKSGLITTLRAGLNFHKKNKGAALIKINDHDPIPLDLSPRGYTLDFRFAGYEFKAGDKIQVITTRPLKGARFGDDQASFLDVNMVPPNSPIKKAVQKRRAQNFSNS